MLRLDNLSTYYGKFEAVKSVSLEVRTGQLVGIIGANGAGKTTLMRTVCGLERQKKGRVLFQDEDVSSLSPVERVKQGIVYCPEGRKLFPFMTVRENLEMGAYTCPDDLEDNLDRVLTLFPVLGERGSELAGSLSGGQQQMLAIGRTLMSTPRLVLFDEPSTGLAPLIAEQLMEVIKGLNEEGMTVLLVEQNVHLALEVAQWGFILENGRIVLSGPAEELKDNQEVKESYLGG